MKEIDRFIKVTCIRNNPGCDPCEMYVRASSILDFSEANPDYAKVGGAAQITAAAGFLVVKESFGDLVELLSKIEVLG